MNKVLTLCLKPVKCAKFTNEVYKITKFKNYYKNDYKILTNAVSDGSITMYLYN